ncbi:MAG: hypothetical protein R2864_06960 [Syntrophotaleaceae bacterium]
MIEEARTKGFSEAERTLTLANEVEKVHARLYQKALDNLGNSDPVDYYVCRVCGNTFEGAPKGFCGICHASSAAAFKVD